MKRIKNINKLREHTVDTKFLVILIVVLSVILVLSTALMIIQTMKANGFVEREKQYISYARELDETSNYLSNNVYYYVVTGDEHYHDDYLHEVYDVKTREKDVEGLLSLGVTTEEEKIITETLELSNDLTEIELEAFDLVEDNKNIEAQELIFSNQYENYKNEIHSNFEVLEVGMVSRVDEEIEFLSVLNHVAFLVSGLVGIGAAVAIYFLIRTVLRIKKESDIDQLTGVQNRNKYKESIEELIKASPDKFGALIFCDIDNLKFINDCYGHSSGDRYIRATANALKVFEEFKCVIARPSGDEFVIYIHGFESKEVMDFEIEEKIKKAKSSYFTTSLHIQEKVRFSTGISVYPTDATVVEELIKFADYAMYKMKTSSKGEVAYYDNTTIDKSLFVAINSGYLDEFIEKEMLDFALQPIVDANTFEIYGYEALIRPQLEVINSPYLLLEVAKAESKLDKIERLVMKNMFEKIYEDIDKLNGKKIFVNSIADQILTDIEIDEYVEKYPNVLKNVVIEVTEQEYIDEELLKQKVEKFKQYGALVALDDYGSGYSNEYSLLSELYDIIKIDMNIIRNIDSDVNRQEIVKTLIKVSESSGYKILAEGVETEREVSILRSLGVDYMQGYFFGKPELTITNISETAINYLEFDRIRAGKSGKN